MKKWTSLALLGLASASLLVACGSKKEESKSSAKEAQTTVKSSQKKAKASSGKKETKTAEASAASSATTTAPKQAQAQTPSQPVPSQGNSANQAGTTTSESDPKTGYGGWEATSGTLTLTQDTPVYTEPNKDGGVAYVQPQGDIQWDKYIFANGDNWYSFVQKNRDQEVRFYIAYSDVGH